MRRPHIICHMISSIDGKALGDFLMREDEYPITGAYEGKIIEYKPDAIVAGSVSLSAGFCSQEPLDLKEFEGVDVPEGDFIADNKAGYYMITIDRIGKMHWMGGYTSAEFGAYGNAHIISILTEQASNAYRAFLRSKGISYIISGKNEVQLADTCERLSDIFKIKTMLILGGPKLNGIFANEELIDELSLVVAPCLAGKQGEGSIVMTNQDMGDILPLHVLSFVEMEQMEQGILWLKYKSKKIIN